MPKRFFTAVFFSILILGMLDQRLACAEAQGGVVIRGLAVGMTSQRLFKQYPRKTARTYRGDKLDEWLTFSYKPRGAAPGMITFHVQEGKLKEWFFNNRQEVIQEYLGEFCSQGIAHGLPKIFAAIQDVLERISLKDFLSVTDRRRPVMFTEYYDAGTARFANTSEIFASPDDAPAFADGVTIIKLSSALNDADTPDPIKGVLAHELAHRVLEHVKKGRVSCDDEREANRLIKTWGFAEEFKQASQLFGRKEGDPSSCQK